MGRGQHDARESGILGAPSRDRLCSRRLTWTEMLAAHEMGGRVERRGQGDLGRGEVICGGDNVEVAREVAGQRARSKRISLND